MRPDEIMSRSENLLTIGGLAKAAGLKATALRYYERERLLSPAGRSGAGYRLYDHDSVERVRFIRSAQAVGFTLEDIRSLLVLESGQEGRCKHEVQELIERRLSEIEIKMNDLKRVKARLSRALSRCRKSAGECPVLHELKPHEEKDRSKR